MQADIVTPRLILRQMQKTDAAAIQDLAGDQKIAMSTLHIPHPFSQKHAEETINSAHEGLSEGTSYHYGVIARNEFIGIASLRLTAGEPGTSDVMYWIGVPYWGQGYATEAAQALVKYGFEELHLQRITGKHALFNSASGRVLQKAGMRYDGIKQKVVYKDGAWLDSSNWSVTAADHFCK